MSFGPWPNLSAKDAAVVDEIFGPVLSVVKVNTFDEALEIENAKYKHFNSNLIRLASYNNK